MITLTDIKNQFKKYIYLADEDIIDVMLGTVIANRLPGDSVSLYIIGPSSSAKTELVDLLIHYPHSCHLSKITPHALVSGYKEPGKKTPNVSKLQRWDNEGRNIIVFKDFTTILSMRREDRAELMSQLREMADGRISGHYGNDQDIVLKAHFGVIAACTNAIDEFTAVTTALGERFLKYRISAEDTSAIANLARETALEKDTLRATAAFTVNQFLQQFEILTESPTWNEEYIVRVEALCSLGAHLRTPIIKDSVGIQVSEVDHEGPGRLITSITKLAMGVSITKHQSIMENNVYPVLKKVIRDTMPPYRLAIIHNLFIYKNMTVSELTGVLNVSWHTIRKYCDDLVSLKILQFDLSDTGKHTRTFKLAPKYIDWIRQSEVFIADKF